MWAITWPRGLFFCYLCRQDSSCWLQLLLPLPHTQLGSMSSGHRPWSSCHRPQSSCHRPWLNCHHQSGGLELSRHVSTLVDDLGEQGPAEQSMAGSLGRNNLLISSHFLIKAKSQAPVPDWTMQRTLVVLLYLVILVVSFRCWPWWITEGINSTALNLSDTRPFQSYCLKTNELNAHTLAQKHLIELLMWNASCVQKHFSYTWQEPLDDQEWETVRRKSFNVLARRLKLFWCSAFILYWHWKFRLRKPCKTRKLKTGCLETAWWFLG